MRIDALNRLAYEHLKGLLEDIQKLIDANEDDRTNRQVTYKDYSNRKNTLEETYGLVSKRLESL